MRNAKKVARHNNGLGVRVHASPMAEFDALTAGNPLYQARPDNRGGYVQVHAKSRHARPAGLGLRKSRRQAVDTRDWYTVPVSDLPPEVEDYGRFQPPARRRDLQWRIDGDGSLPEYRATHHN